MSDIGFKVSSKGVDVKTGGVSDLLLDSEYQTLRIYKLGTTTITTDGSGNGTATVSHGLPYTPAFMVFMKAEAVHPKTEVSSGNVWFDTPGWAHTWLSWSSYNSDFNAYTDTANLNLIITGGTASTTFTFKYFILLDLAKEYTSTGSIGTQDIGFKLAKEQKDVKDSKQYELTYLSSTKTFKYLSAYSGTRTMHLNAMSSTTDIQVASLDITHNLGYPPVFLVYRDSSLESGTMRCPTIKMDTTSTTHLIYSAEAWSNSTKVQCSIYRGPFTKRIVSGGGIGGPGGGTPPPTPYGSLPFPAEDVTFKYIIFSEPLE